MIFTFIIDSTLWLLGLLVDVLPNGQLPAAAVSSVQSVFGYLGMVDVFLDIDTLIAAFKVMLVVEFAIFILGRAMWLYSKIPIIGKK